MNIYITKNYVAVSDVFNYNFKVPYSTVATQNYIGEIILLKQLTIFTRIM